MLRSWAEQLLQETAPADVIDRHVTDIVTAFHVGLKTKEGQALAAFFGAEKIAAAAAIARLSECDDIHLASCVTPGAVVIPVALALGAQEFHRAVAAGYAAGLRLGAAIGGAKALAAGVWPSLLAAPLMAAVTASCINGQNAGQLAHAMALALAGANGRPGRPIGAPSGRWFLFGEAVLRGLRASAAAGHGFRGDLELLHQIDSAAPAASISDVGFKPFPIARQGANAVAAFRHLLAKGLDPHRIKAVEVHVPGINVALLNRPLAEDDRLSRLSNIGFQLACAGLAPELLYDAERATRDAALLQFARLVTVKPAGDLEAHLPGRWAARVVVNTDSEQLEETVIVAPFDADSPDLAHVLDEKWRRLVPPRTETADRAVLWQEIEGCVSMAARSRRERSKG